MLSEEVKYKLLRVLEEDPRASQRELASALDISLGKTNYCLRALIDKGWIKARNFKNSNNKAAYFYKLTPKGIAEKAKVTQTFLARKETEYKAMEQEIERLRKEVMSTDDPVSTID